MIPTSLSPLVSKEVYHLFGFPIAHSASPAFHNYIFSRLGLHDRTYKLTPVTHIGRQIREICRAKDFGGASVTMPLKVTIGCILDEVTDEARAIGAVNTLVQECDERDKKVLVGTNTDWLGIRTVLLQYLGPAPCTEPAAGQVVSGVAGLVLGGGGAARAAVYALASLECAPIYLVGRDMSELEALVVHFPQIPCVPISDPADAVNVQIAVGCIPAVAPVTPEEVAADVCARRIFSSPSSSSGGNKRVFLDMCYKPRTTPLMLHAGGAGWIVVSGIEAMIEQGFAQARMWLAKSVHPRDSMDFITREIEDDVRAFIRGMPDIVSADEGSPHDDNVEVDR